MEATPDRAGVLVRTTQPGAVLPSQCFGAPRRQEPEQRLMIAVLHDALACFEKHRFATTSRARRLFDGARAWFLADEPEWLYSFEYICGVLDLDSIAVRERLRVVSAPPSAPELRTALLFGWDGEAAAAAPVRAAAAVATTARVRRPPTALRRTPRAGPGRSR